MSELNFISVIQAVARNTVIKWVTTKVQHYNNGHVHFYMYDVVEGIIPRYMYYVIPSEK